MFKTMLLLIITLFFSACSYMGSVSRYYESQDTKIRDGNNLCLVSDECTIVHGEFHTDNPSTYIALISQMREGEQVLLTANVLSPSHRSKQYKYTYGIYLPVGEFHIDIIHSDSSFKKIELVTQNSEVINVLKEDIYGESKKIVVVDTIIESKNRDIKNDHTRYIKNQLHVKKVETLLHNQQMFNRNKIYTTDDPIFSQKMVEYGMFNIAKFSKHADYIYAFDTPDTSKIPVLFVHGSFGSPKNFAKMINELDRDKYVPYAIYYPTGESLKFYADIFASVFLSSHVVQDIPFIVVAHSNGGLMVRDAFNKKESYHTKSKHLFISIASPFAGLESAKGAQKAPYVIPLWKDVASDSLFIENLFSHTLHNTTHDLIFAYKGESGFTILGSENSDGVVTLKSQLRSDVQDESQSVYGFNESHTSILESDEVKKRVDTLMDRFYDEIKAGE